MCPPSPPLTAALRWLARAGKTTLLDVLAGRKTTGKVRGLITLNGQEVTPLMLSRIAVSHSTRRA